MSSTWPRSALLDRLVCCLLDPLHVHRMLMRNRNPYGCSTYCTRGFRRIKMSCADGLLVVGSVPLGVEQLADFNELFLAVLLQVPAAMKNISAEDPLNFTDRCS